MRRPAFHLTALVLIIATASLTHRVVGSASRTSESHRVASVDILSLLEDYLQTDRFKPERDTFRDEWEPRMADMQQILAGLEAELQMATPQTPGVQQLQQRYQQAAYQAQQMQREASLAFDRFSAEQAAEGYATLHEQAITLATELGYTHLVASRQSGSIEDRGNLSAVTQEILARPVMLAPEGNDLTLALREKLSIPVATPDEEEIGADEGAAPSIEEDAPKDSDG